MPIESFLAIFVFSFTLTIGASMSPGPVTTAIVSQAPRAGWRVGPLISVGHAIIELLLVLALATGLQNLLSEPGVELSVALLGGFLLIWMGFSILLSLMRDKHPLPLEATQPQPLVAPSIVWLGILATISNPFWFAWWVSVPLSYLSQAEQLGLFALLVFYLGHISADFAWNSFLAAALASGRKWISQRAYRFILAASALFYTYLGITFLALAYRLFRAT